MDKGQQSKNQRGRSTPRSMPDPVPAEEDGGKTRELGQVLLGFGLTLASSGEVQVLMPWSPSQGYVIAIGLIVASLFLIFPSGKMLIRDVRQGSPGVSQRLGRTAALLVLGGGLALAIVNLLPGEYASSERAWLSVVFDSFRAGLFDEQGSDGVMLIGFTVNNPTDHTAQNVVRWAHSWYEPKLLIEGEERYYFDRYKGQSDRSDPISMAPRSASFFMEPLKGFTSTQLRSLRGLTGFVYVVGSVTYDNQSETEFCFTVHPNRTASNCNGFPMMR